MHYGNIRGRIREYEIKSLDEIENNEDREIVKIIRRLDEEYAYGRGQLHENLGNALKIENWCKENFDDKQIWERRLPSVVSKDEEEKKLGVKLGSLRKKIKKHKSKNLEDIEDNDDRTIVEIISGLDKEYGLSEAKKNVYEIKEWCEKNFEYKPVWGRRLPCSTSNDKKEKDLGTKLSTLRKIIKKRHKNKDLDKIENEEDREIVEIIRKLDNEYAYGSDQLHENLGKILKIENWCKENFEDKPVWERRLPSVVSKDEEEKKLGEILMHLRKKYEGKDLDGIEDEEDRKIAEIIRKLDDEYAYGRCQLHGNLGNALEIENWCKENFEDKPVWERRLPHTTSNDKKEKDLGIKLRNVKISLRGLQNDDSKKIIEILKSLERDYAYGRNQVHETLGSILKIKKWCKENYRDKQPSERKLPTQHSNNAEERSLGTLLSNIRVKVKKYKNQNKCNSQGEENKEYIRIMEELERLDEEYNPQKTKLQQAKQQRDSAEVKNNETRALETQVLTELEKKRGKNLDEQ